MSRLSFRTILFIILPVVIGLIVVTLISIYLPAENTDTRSRASEAASIITPEITPTATPDPNDITCTDLYEPVCGENNLTYFSPCEAERAGVAYTSGSCN